MAMRIIGESYPKEDDRKCRIDVAHIVAVGHPVKVEIHRVELRQNFSIKAVGMTLNRLAKEGRARRAGQVWFRVRQGLQMEDVGPIAF
jgi:hypothetical protein